MGSRPKGGTPQTVIMEKDARVFAGRREHLNRRAWRIASGFTVSGRLQVRSQPVNRWALGLVISIAVLGICLWGTSIGCLIPLILQKIGWDPAVASGAMVATFVDVTGIAIFFGSAWLILL